MGRERRSRSKRRRKSAFPAMEGKRTPLLPAPHAQRLRGLTVEEQHSRQLLSQEEETQRAHKVQPSRAGVLFQQLAWRVHLFTLHSAGKEETHQVLHHRLEAELRSMLEHRQAHSASGEWEGLGHPAPSLWQLL